MRFLLYSDLHVTHRNREYMRFLELTLSYLKEVVHERKVEGLINLGDTFDTFGVLDLRDAVWGVEAMRDLTRVMEGNHLILRGNHDTGDKMGELASTTLLEYGDTCVVSTPGPVDFCGLRFYCLPHSHEYAEATQALKEDTQGAQAVLAHLDWTGCRLTPSYVSKDGVLPSDADVGIPVFSGHYHSPMEAENVWFVGSPLYMTFSDEVTETSRGFTLWDTETGEKTRIENPHTYKCWTFRVEDKRMLNKIQKKLEGKADTSRVRLYVPKRLIDDALEMFSGCLWSAVYPLDSEKETVSFNADVDLTTTPEDVIKRAIEAAPEDLDRKLLEEYGALAFKEG